MIESNTVLVLGAGASMPYGFPSGKTLKSEIYTTLNNRSNMTLNELTTPDVLRSFIDRLKYSPEESIDAFLEHETDGKIIEFGKMAIAATLLPYEQEETLFNNFLTNEEKEENFNWYQYLWNQINTSFDDFEKNLSIITFNYDRSLEYFLYTALKYKYPGKNIDDYKNKLNDIPIIHVYGKLGNLPWESAEDEKSVPYNYDWKKTDNDFDTMYEKKCLIQNASKQIEIVHENKEISERERIKELLNSKERIYFLGFGYHPINLSRLLGNLQRKSCQIRGAMYKISLKTKTQAQEIIKKFRPNTGWDWEVTFPDTTIYDFLYNHIIL
jgi:NAD-dependent SIR2 family protein deacetylase